MFRIGTIECPSDFVLFSLLLGSLLQLLVSSFQRYFPVVKSSLLTAIKRNWNLTFRSAPGIMETIFRGIKICQRKLLT